MNVHPGEYLKLEMDSRNETLQDLAAVLKIPEHQLQDVLNGKSPFTPQMASLLEKHWGSSGFMLLECQKDLDGEALDG
ncbi:helix-turn-helix transcriptional regulator [Deinococcus cellulosilyticus]|nr:hypothetical protein [Deinococcus cellulosilyticus]